MDKMKRSPAQFYSIARGTLLSLTLFTVLNCILYLTGSDSYYIVSIRLAYTFFEPTASGIPVPLVIVAAFAAAWVLSAKRGGWMVAGLVMTAVDALFVGVLLVYFRDYPEVYLNLGIDVIVHIVAVVLLALGVKHRRAALLSDEELMRANAPGGTGSEAAEEFPELECTVGISNTTLSPLDNREGIVRFEAEDIVIGTRGGLSGMVLGSLSSFREAGRFSYSGVVQVTFTNKKQTALQLNFGDGYIVGLTMPGVEAAERCVHLLQLHGVPVPQRTV